VDSSAHPGSPGTIFSTGTSGQLVDSGMRFGSPFVVVDPAEKAWLFFSAQAYKDKGVAEDGSQSRVLDSRIYFTEVTNGHFGDNPVTPVGRDSAMPKFGINALATDSSFWCFWYGGTNNKWRIYYTMSTDTGANWQQEVQLPVPKGLTSVAQPCAMFRPVIGSNTNLIEVAYTGYSSYHKNSDIYLSLYAWNATKKRLELKGLTEQNEALARSATEPVWYSKDVDWVADDADDFSVQVVVGSTTYELTAGRAYTVDKATGARVYAYADAADDTLRALFRAVVVDPAAGTVRFMRTPPKTAVVQATYTAMATRLTVDSVSDVAPVTFWDRSKNPRYVTEEAPSNFRFFFPNGVNAEALTDRMWIFWKRPGVDKQGTGIHYGTFRYSIDLDMSNPIKKGASCPVISINGATKPVEIDWIKNRLYFMSEDAGKTVTVYYTNTSGGTSHVDGKKIALRQETGQDGGRSFGNLTRLMVNEGQVSAFKDPLENKVWIFWTSTRSGNTDIYYETISPRFYGAEY
jgi:hypothetical protein